MNLFEHLELNSKDINIYRSIEKQIRKSLSYEDRWNSTEKGLITAWEAGRKLRTAKSHKELVDFLKKGALPKLEFRGGHKMPPYKNDEPPKYKFKYGHYNYLAQMQGMLGQDLNINIQDSEEQELVCKLSGKKTVFTFDIFKFMTKKEIASYHEWLKKKEE